jgi:hypothetical protein
VTWSGSLVPNLRPYPAASAARSPTVAAAASRCWLKPVLAAWHQTQAHGWCQPCSALTWLTMAQAEQRRRKYERRHCGHDQCVWAGLADSLLA